LPALPSAPTSLKEPGSLVLRFGGSMGAASFGIDLGHPPQIPGGGCGLEVEASRFIAKMLGSSAPPTSFPVVGLQRGAGGCWLGEQLAPAPAGG